MMSSNEKEILPPKFSSSAPNAPHHVSVDLVFSCHVVRLDLDLDLDNLDLGLDVVNLIKCACESSNLPLAQ